MNDKNIKQKNSVILSGNAKIIEIVNFFKQNNYGEYLRFIFNGEKVNPNDKVTIVPIYDGGQYQMRNLALSENVKI